MIRNSLQEKLALEKAPPATLSALVLGGRSHQIVLSSLSNVHILYQQLSKTFRRIKMSTNFYVSSLFETITDETLENISHN